MSNAHPKNEAGNQRPRRRRPRQGAGRKRRKKARNEEGAGRKRSKKARKQEGRPRRIGRRLRNAPEIGPRERYRKVRILPTNLWNARETRLQPKNMKKGMKARQASAKQRQWQNAAGANKQRAERTQLLRELANIFWKPNELGLQRLQRSNRMTPKETTQGARPKRIWQRVTMTKWAQT